MMGKPLTVTIPHDLGRLEARKRIDEGLADLSGHLGGGAVGPIDRRWDGDRLSFAFSTLGQAVTGVIAVAEAVVTVEVILPGLLAMLGGKVKGALQREGQLLLQRK